MDAEEATEVDYTHEHVVVLEMYEQYVEEGEEALEVAKEAWVAVVDKQLVEEGQVDKTVEAVGELDMEMVAHIVMDVEAVDCSNQVEQLE